MLSSTLSSKTVSSTKEGLKSITTQIHNQFIEQNTISYSTLLKTVSARNPNTLKRRVYDVLSVLRALNIIEKKNREYHLTERKNNNIKTRLKNKIKELKRLEECKASLEFMIDRNKCSFNANDKLYTPFVVVSTNKNVIVNCEINEERDFFKIISQEPITVNDDLGVIKEIYEKRNEGFKDIFEKGDRFYEEIENNYNFRA
ncbi:Transcription factor dpl-1 [Gurleya vavrai]